MICLKCGKKLRSVNNSHLLKCSNITIQQYREEFPDTVLTEPDVLKSYINVGSKNGRWRKDRIRNCEICDKLLYRKTKGVRCIKCKFIGKPPNFKGCKHSPESLEKMRDKAYSRNQTEYKGTYRTPENISKDSKRYWDNITTEKKNKHLKNFILAGQKSNKKSSKTKIENIINELLIPLELDFKRNENVDKFNVDFLIPSKNLIIECYGDYWHCNPKFYDGDFYNKSLHMTAKEKWEKDKKRLDFLEKLGYTVLIFWGEDIKKEIEKIRNKIYVYIQR